MTDLENLPVIPEGQLCEDCQADADSPAEEPATRVWIDDMDVSICLCDACYDTRGWDQ